ncbi:MAG: UDP-N-acetylmuramate--L-alanine ligase [Fusobacteriota bacterium]
MKIFFIGINGIGMSALAQIARKKGYDVYGSDLTKKPIAKKLEEMGIKVYNRHIDIHLRGMDLVVYSSAIKPNNPEYVYAKLNGIPILKRGEFLAKLFNEKKGIAVSGTHGKTSVSSMLAVILEEVDPTVVVGGIIPELGSNSKKGEGKYFIAEADESDNSFLYLNPFYAIITNIEEEHMEIHGSYENLKNSFNKFIEQTRKEVLINKDCKELYNIAKKHPDKIKTYSINEKTRSEKTPDIYAKNIKKGQKKISYEVILEGESLGEFSLKFLGEHNLSNSLGVIYIAYKLGIPLDEIKEKLFKFIGPKRRFEVMYDKEITIIDDYAHHPTEVKATLKMAKEHGAKKLIAIFQPHKYSRTNFLLKKYENAFRYADELILLPIYSAGEENYYDVTVEKLNENINFSGTKKIERDKKKLFEKLKDLNNGEYCLFLGAGDINKISREFVEMKSNGNM